MGCRAYVVVTRGEQRHLDEAVTRLRELESHWSRFVGASDVTLANQNAGSPVHVHADTIAVVTRALEAWRQTRGRFDITTLPALVHHGYTHSIAGPADGRLGDAAPTVSGSYVALCGELVVDAWESTITVPAGTAIDLGGIGKGFAADIVAGELIAAGCTGALVNIGGDIAVRGQPADGEVDWVIGVDNPLQTGQLVTRIALASGGVATSGTTVRRWTTANGETAHHLIDPSTAMPAATALLTATVVAGDAATAEAFATAAMLADGPAAIELFESVGLAGAVIAADGAIMRSSAMQVFER